MEQPRVRPLLTAERRIKWDAGRESMGNLSVEESQGSCVEASGIQNIKRGGGGE